MGDLGSIPSTEGFPENRARLGNNLFPTHQDSLLGITRHNPELNRKRENKRFVIKESLSFF